jgi:hypothetical protein
MTVSNARRENTRGALPTYVAVPLVVVLVAIAAALPALASMAKTRPLLALGSGIIWLGLVIVVIRLLNRAPAPRGACRCVSPPLDYRDYERRDIGIDDTHGRFATVAVERCHRCGQNWLVYACELEHASRSGRWYRAPVTYGQAAEATAGGALDTIASVGWYLYGGSYFDSQGKRSDQPLDPAHI